VAVLLALDSATESLALALAADGKLFLREEEGGAQASTRIVPLVHELLAEAGRRLADVDAIAFGRGPGAFTGLRTACAVAQGLAFGAGKPVLPIDSLLIVAEDARAQAEAAGTPQPASLWVAMDARMDEIYAAQYGWDGARWQTRCEPALYAPDALRVRWGRPDAAAGNALEVFAPALGSIEPAWPRARSRAAALGRLAAQAWDQGLRLDAAQAQPVYVRDKVALTTAERLAAGGVR